MSNANLTSGTDSGDADGLLESITVKKSYADVRAGSEQFKMLNDDFAQLASMNLVDDDDYCYTLFMKSPLFDNTTFLCNALNTLYAEKYKDLLEKYPGILPWLTCCVSFCLARSEADLKLECNDNMKVIRPSTSSVFTLITKRKSASRKESFGSSGSSLDAGAEKKKAKLSAAQNPLFDHPIYKTHKVLFNIGKCASYCVPADFGALFMVPSLSNVTRQSNGKSSTVMGLRTMLTRPIIASLQSRSVKQYHYYNLCNVDFIIDVIKAMTNLEVKFNVISAGTMKDVRMLNIFNKSDRRGESVGANSELDPNLYYFVFINQFSTCAERKKTDVSLDLRCYYPTRYTIDVSMFELNETASENYKNTLSAKENELDDIYTKYRDIVENSEGANDVVDAFSL